MNGKVSRLLRDTVIFGVGSVGSKLILFMLVPLYTNAMPADEYGTADLVVTIGQLIMPFVSLVVFDAELRFALSRHERKEDVLLISFVVLAAGSLATVVLAPLAGLYSAVADYKWLLCAYVVTYMASNVELVYLKVIDRNKLYAILSVLQTFLIASLSVLLIAVLGMGVEGYLFANIVALGAIDVIVFFAGGIMLALRRARFDAGLARRMLSYSAPLVMNNVSWWIIHSIDKVMVEAVLGAAALGLFTVASKIPSLINTVVSIFQQAWGISTVREVESTNDSAYYSEVFSVYSMLCLGACIVLVAVIRPFMIVYVGAEYLDAWRYVPLLLVAAAMSGVASFFGSLYGALMKSVNSMLTTLVSAVVNAVVCWTLIASCGVWAAVLGTLASYAVLAFSRMLDVLRFIKFDVRLGRYLGCLAVALAQAVFVSLNWHAYPVSVLCLGIFVVLNWDALGRVIHARRRA